MRGKAGRSDPGDAGGAKTAPGSAPGNHPAGEAHQKTEADMGIYDVPPQRDQPERHCQRGWGESTYGGETLCADSGDGRAWIDGKMNEGPIPCLAPPSRWRLGEEKFSKRLEMISGFSGALLTVLNGLRRTMTDTRHAVGAVAVPNRPAVLNGNVVGRAEPDTLAAAGAGIAGRKRLRFDKERIEDRIHRAAHEAVIKVIAGHRECLVSRDGRDCAVNVRLRLGNNLPCLLRLGRVEHGNVILGHDNLRCLHIGELFFPTKRMVIFGGIADLTAAGHDEPRLLGPGELCPAQPVLHQTGDAPGVGGCDDHQALICLDRRGVLRFDAVVHAEKLVIQSFCNALGNVPAVAGTAEIEYHVCTSLPDGKGRDGLRGLPDLLLTRNGGSAVAILRAIASKLGVAAAV